MLSGRIARNGIGLWVEVMKNTPLSWNRETMSHSSMMPIIAGPIGSQIRPTVAQAAARAVRARAWALRNVFMISPPSAASDRAALLPARGPIWTEHQPGIDHIRHDDDDGQANRLRDQATQSDDMQRVDERQIDAHADRVGKHEGPRA